MLESRERGVKVDTQFLDYDAPRVYARGCRVGDFIFLAGVDAVLMQMHRAATAESPAPAGVD